MRKCNKCGVTHSGAHECTEHYFCRDCRQSYPESEINGHVCSGDYNANFLRHFKTEAGVKHDESKIDLSLLPKELLEETAKAFMWGEKKYGRNNFRGGMEHHRLVAAALRHITAYNSGEDNDIESGNSHLGHAVASLGMLLVLIKTGKGQDTRFKGE